MTDANRPRMEVDEQPLARFSLIYESEDGKLCLFQDADGHLTAVRASRLATRDDL